MNNNFTNFCDLSYYNPIAIKIAEYVTDKNNNTIINYMIKDNNFKLCKNLLSLHNFYITIEDLFYAINKNNTKMIQLLLNNFNIDLINYTDKNNETLLCHAVRNNNSYIAKLLVYMGADVDGCDNVYKSIKKKLNYTPLCLSVMNNNYKLTKFLLFEEANPNIWSDGFGGNNSYSPLHKAIKNNNLKMIKLLLKYGAVSEDKSIYLNNYSFNYESPLQYAINLNFKNIKKIIKLFFAYNQYR